MYDNIYYYFAHTHYIILFAAEGASAFGARVLDIRLDSADASRFAIIVL